MPFGLAIVQTIIQLLRISAVSFIVSVPVLLPTLSEAKPKTFYEMLGVPEEASDEAIKKAYKRLSLDNHPDRKPDDADALSRFKEAQEAYEVLGDVEKRAYYDRHGTIAGFGMTRWWAEDEMREQREREKKDWAERVGPLYSNNLWTYEPVSRRIYDNRIGKWLSVDFRSFRSEEGWLFSGQSGTYRCLDLQASWDPNDSVGWYRSTSNRGNQLVLIDATTGFSRDAVYAPGSVSDSSQLFDVLMNPMNLLNFRSDRGNRVELMRKLDALPWNESQVSDFLTRAMAHTTILTRSDMKINFANDAMYFIPAMEAILDYEIVRQNPSVVVDFLRRAEWYRSVISEELFLHDKWFNHANATVWLSELFLYPEGAEGFTNAALSREPATTPTAGRAKVRRFANVFDLMIDRIGPSTLHYLIAKLSQYENDGFDVLEDRMIALTSNQLFYEMIARVESKTKNSTMIRQFLNWYSQHDPKRSKVFEDALKLASDARLDFLKINLPQPILRKTTTNSTQSCGDGFGIVRTGL